MAEKQDIRENAMAGGTPARLRGLAAMVIAYHQHWQK